MRVLNDNALVSTASPRTADLRTDGEARVVRHAHREVGFALALLLVRACRASSTLKPDFTIPHRAAATAGVGEISCVVRSSVPLGTR